MSVQNGIGIKQLTRLLPEGVAAPSVWLTANGYSRQLVRKYVLSDWLKSLSHGAYARPGQAVGWRGCCWDCSGWSAYPAMWADYQP